MFYWKGLRPFLNISRGYGEVFLFGLRFFPGLHRSGGYGVIYFVRCRGGPSDPPESGAAKATPLHLGTYLHF
jgi:hypothetical protein